MSSGPITRASISLDSDSPRLQFIDRDNLGVVVEGITIGSQATTVTWTRNGSQVSRNTMVTGGSFYDGGGEAIDGSGPCSGQMYRVALFVMGYLPGEYAYTVQNSDTPDPLTSLIYRIQGESSMSAVCIGWLSCLNKCQWWYQFPVLQCLYFRCTYKIMLITRRAIHHF